VALVRKEGVIFIGVGLMLLFLSTNLYHIFDAIALFIVAGGIPGTSVSLPDSLMLGCSLLALITVVSWPFRDAISEKFVLNKKITRPLQSKRRQG
jgi:hypothetical protein